EGEGRSLGPARRGRRAPDAAGEGSVRPHRDLQPRPVRGRDLMAFDIHRQPQRDLIDVCTHCGFCLPMCPTYLLWGEEMDSPRGRIVLMRAGLDETGADPEAGAGMPADMATHFDRCLGCMACVTACPSGVRYDRLIEDTRQQVERRHERPARDRALRAAVFALFPYPRRLRALRGPLRAYQASHLAGLVERLLPDNLATAQALAPRLRRRVPLPRRV